MRYVANTGYYTSVSCCKEILGLVLTDSSPTLLPILNNCLFTSVSQSLYGLFLWQLPMKLEAGLFVWLR
jgi:hypothetical protein